MTNPLPIPILGVDAEAKSLHGRAFCAALVLAEPDGLTFRDEFVVRCPLVGDPDPWVAEHVLPAIASVPVTHDSYEDMCDALHERITLWSAGDARPAVVAHVAWPVETRLLSDIYSRPGREFTGPYPLLDTAVMAAALGEPEPCSDDAYLTRHGIHVSGSAHHPARDARAAVTIYAHMTGTRAARRALSHTQRDRDRLKARG